MNWAGLIAALVAVLLVQTTLCQMADLPVVDLDLLLVLALVYGLVAPAHDARLAALVIGFAVDMTTEGAVGVHTFAFGLTGLLLTKMREVVNRQLSWVRLLIAFLAALPGQLVIVLHLRYWQGANLGPWWELVTSAALVSISAACLTTVVTLVPSLTPRRRGAPRVPWVRR